MSSKHLLKNILISSFIASSTFYLGACASAAHPYDPKDPLQSINRVSFAFNDGFDKLILKPAAQGYTAITPKPVRTGVNNFFGNLGEIPTTVNNLLQFQLKDACDSFGRLLMNSTVGILGFIDVAQYAGLHREENDFGITLAKWGFTSSPYLVIPFIGPSNVRDGLSLWVDYEYFSVWGYIHSDELLWGLLIVDYVRIRANYLDKDELLDLALDRYTLLRDAYIQKRGATIASHGAHWDEADAYSLMDEDLELTEIEADLPESEQEAPEKVIKEIEDSPPVSNSAVF